MNPIAKSVLVSRTSLHWPIRIYQTYPNAESEKGRRVTGNRITLEGKLRTGPPSFSVHVRCQVSLPNFKVVPSQVRKLIHHACVHVVVQQRGAMPASSPRAREREETTI